MSKNKIQNSVNSVEPENGAKERMYQNIMKKAQQQTAAVEKKKKPIPFARYALPVAACLCLIIFGAARLIPSSTPVEPDGNNVQIANPFVEADSAEDFKSIAISLDAPDDAKNVRYAIIDNEIVDVQFELNGASFTARASVQSGDFSGLNGSEEELEAIDAAYNAVLSVVHIDSEQIYKVTWTNGNANYCLYAADEVQSEQIKAAYEAIAK